MPGRRTDGPGVFAFEWTGTDDDGQPMRYGSVLDCCSWAHAEKRCAELGVELMGKVRDTDAEPE